jgi:hypothetical protein
VFTTQILTKQKNVFSNSWLYGMPNKQNRILVAVLKCMFEWLCGLIGFFCVFKKCGEMDFGTIPTVTYLLIQSNSKNE